MSKKSTSPFRLLVGFMLFFSSAAAAVNFPLRVGPSGRYLVDQSGAPYLIQADSAWSMIIALNQAEVQQYLDDRQSRGFNTVLVELIEHEFNGFANQQLGRKSPMNRHGDVPFNIAGDFSTPNEAYFSFADWMIDQAAKRNMTVVLFPCYVGYPSSEGWYNEIVANGAAKCHNYGAYLGNRYKNKPNIIWAMYGDHNPDNVLQPLIETMVAGIKSVDHTHLFTAHLRRNFNMRAELNDPPWLDIATAYTDQFTYAKNGGTLTACRILPAKPVLLIESDYEGEHYDGYTPPAAVVRAEAYWAFLTGACGQTFGNNPVWLFGPGWEAALNSDGSNDITRANAFFRSQDWTKFVPDRTHTAVVSGYGVVGRANYVAAAMSSDRSSLIAYLPQGGTIVADLSKVAGQRALASWFNPRTGDQSPAGTYDAAIKQKFSAPNDEDWVLVIEAAGHHRDTEVNPKIALQRTGTACRTEIREKSSLSPIITFQ